MDEASLRSRMRILITQESDWLKRNPLQQHHLAEMLSLRGHDIRVIDYELLWRTQGKKELYSRREVHNDVSKIYSGAKITVIRPGIIKIPWLDYISLIFSHRREIAQQIKEFKPDVVVGFGILNSYLAVKAAKKNNLPFIYHWLDVLHWLIPFKPFQAIGKIIESRVLRQADRIVVVSDKLKDFVIELGASPGRIQIVKPGISLRQFDLAISGAAARKQYGIKENDIVIFFMGWLYHFSGLKEVALELAKAKSGNLKFLIVGEGDAYAELQRIQQEYNLQDRVILTGQQPYPEIPGFIAASDICLLPAYPAEKIMHDGLPGKIYEYMAMQKPLISTKLPGVIREFGQGNGVVYVDQPEDVITKANELVHSGKLEELGLKARRFVERYGWDKITDEFEKILKEATRDK
ncbi:glycosyltransferase family 4 protein [Chloroflexota bacterium]